MNKTNSSDGFWTEELIAEYAQRAKEKRRRDIGNRSTKQNIFSKIRKYLLNINYEVPAYWRYGDKNSIVNQLSDIVKLYRLYKVFPYHYMKYHLYRVDAGKSIVRYIPIQLLHDCRDRVNSESDKYLALDKLVFEDKMRRAGIRATNTVFRIDRLGQTIIDRDGDLVPYEVFCRQIGDLKLPKGILIKPQTGGSGNGVFIMTVGDQGPLFHEGKALNSASFFDTLGSRGGELWSDFVVQETINQHSLLERFNKSSVNSIRIDTLMDTNGEVQFNAATLKFGAKGEITDNASTGGYRIGIELETGGIFGPALIETKFGGQEIELEAILGAGAEGLQIPYWSELKSLVVRAALQLPTLRSLGWDIAISDDGPVIIETNYDYGIDVQQESAGGFIDKPLGRAYLETLPSERRQSILEAAGLEAAD